MEELIVLCAELSSNQSNEYENCAAADGFNKFIHIFF